MEDTVGAFVPDGLFELEGARQGPLSGLSFAAKDIIDVAGRVTGCGNPDWAASHPAATAHAPVVAAMLALADTVTKFLEKNPSGGMHHVCYEVEDILAARDQLKAEGARVLGSGEPSIGAHDKPVLFLHPKDFSGTLIELEQL